MIPIFQFAIISVLLTAATLSDIRTREVSDIFSVGILLTAFLNFNIENLIGLVIPSLCLVIAVICGGFGGADVKIIAALSVVIGLEGSVLLVLIALISMLLFHAFARVIRKLRKKSAAKSYPFVPFIFIGYVCTEILLF